MMLPVDVVHIASLVSGALGLGGLSVAARSVQRHGSSAGDMRRLRVADAGVARIRIRQLSARGHRTRRIVTRFHHEARRATTALGRGADPGLLFARLRQQHQAGLAELRLLREQTAAPRSRPQAYTRHSTRDAADAARVTREAAAWTQEQLAAIRKEHRLLAHTIQKIEDSRLGGPPLPPTIEQLLSELAASAFDTLLADDESANVQGAAN